MAEYLIQDTTLDAIADAINAKTGGSSAMTPAEMVTAIGSIPSGLTIPQFEKFEIYTYVPVSDTVIGLGEAGTTPPASIPHPLGVVPDFVYGINIGNNMDNYVSGQMRVRQFGRQKSPNGSAIDNGYQREGAWNSMTTLHTYKDGGCDLYADHFTVGQALAFNHTFCAGDVFIIMMGKWVTA